MEPIEQIEVAAEQHRSRYKSFAVDRFMVWVSRHSYEWQSWAVEQPIASLSRLMRLEAYASFDAVRESRKKKYTPEPGVD